MKRFLFLFLMLLAGCTELHTKAAAAPEPLRLYVFNVRKADCLLLQYQNKNYLIDTGSSESVPQMVGILRGLGVTHLDSVILTHTDADHGGGLAALCDSGIGIDSLYASAYYNCKEKKHPAIKASAKTGLPLGWLKSGDTLPFADGSLTVLGPLSKNESSENCNSLVLLAEASSSSILLAGDMELPEEEALLSRKLIPPADLIKIGNHGESDATGEALVATVRPQAAIISTNSYDEPDTPSKRVLKLLMKQGVHIFLTENTEDGILAELSEGEILINHIPPRSGPNTETKIRILRKDTENDILTLTNEGDNTADLSGWFLFSEKGKEFFFFPDGTLLSPGKTLDIGTLSSPAFSGLLWKEENIWHNQKQDTAILYDASGHETDRMD